MPPKTTIFFGEVFLGVEAVDIGALPGLFGLDLMVNWGALWGPSHRSIPKVPTGPLIKDPGIQSSNRHPNHRARPQSTNQPLADWKVLGKKYKKEWPKYGGSWMVMFYQGGIRKKSPTKSWMVWGSNFNTLPETKPASENTLNAGPECGAPDHLNQPLIFRGKLLVPGRLVLMILLMAEILHQLIGSLSHYLQGFIYPRRCRISSTNSTYNFINKNLPNMRCAKSSIPFLWDTWETSLQSHLLPVPGKGVSLAHQVVANKRYDIYTGLKRKTYSYTYIHYIPIYVDI